MAEEKLKKLTLAYILKRITEPMNKIEFNMTADSVAKKNREPLPEAISRAYKTVNDAIAKLEVMAIDPVHLTAKLADIAEQQYETATVALNAYEARLENDALLFEKTVMDLTKPSEQIEIFESVNLQTQLMSGNKDLLDLAKTDSKVAAAGLRLSEGTQKKLKLDPVLMKEALLPGYVAETKRFQDLIDNVERARNTIDKTIGPLFTSTQAQAARRDVKQFKSM